MENEIVKPNQTMSSLEIAEISGKSHNDLLKSIRAMEPAWYKVTEGKFSRCKYKGLNGKNLPMFELTKRECLYVTSKFNDEVRAKLVIRWEELELKNQKESIELATKQNKALEEKNNELRSLLDGADFLFKDMAPKSDYCDMLFKSRNTYSATKIAEDYGMRATSFNYLLYDLGIQYKEDGCWQLYEEYENQGYTERNYYRETKDGELQLRPYMVWTEKGRFFIHEQLRKRHNNQLKLQ